MATIQEIADNTTILSTSKLIATNETDLVFDLKFDGDYNPLYFSYRLVYRWNTTEWEALWSLPILYYDNGFGTPWAQAWSDDDGASQLIFNTSPYSPDEPTEWTLQIAVGGDRAYVNAGNAYVRPNVAPEAFNLNLSMNENNEINAELPAAEDTDQDELTFLVSSNPSNGVLVLNSDGTFIYTPESGFTGEDQFTYVANDGFSDSNEATVKIKISESIIIQYSLSDPTQWNTSEFFKF